MENNNFISELKEEGRILNLQKKIEAGQIQEEDLTDIEKEKIIRLYKKQINDLKQEIENNNRAIESYKEKIINIRKKLNNQ